MQPNWFNITIIVIEWLLFSIGLFGVARKLGWKRPWLSFIPCARFFAFGKSIAQNGSGIFCGIMDAIFVAGAITSAFVKAETVIVIFTLVILILFVILVIIRIRMFLQVIKIFGRSKWWIVLFLIANWLPLIIFGYGKTFQPQKDFQLEETWQAGTAPAEIPGTEALHKFELCNEGLSIDLRERTAKSLGKKRYLLKDICLNIPNKSMVLLLGGSGAGKTTLINAVTGYEKADATVLLNGRDVYKDYDSVKYRIGYVPQKNLIRGKDTVKRTVNDAAYMRIPKNTPKEEKKNRISEVMDLLGLTAGCEGLVEKKSGGQLRRISIAMELVADPELFILDEPDSGLDGAIAREMFKELRGIADEGRIVIAISHTPDRVINLFDKIIVLGRDSSRVGRLVFYGSPDEAREFFGKDTMEGIVVSINSRDEGGEGLADELIEKYANLTAAEKEGEAS